MRTRLCRSGQCERGGAVRAEDNSPTPAIAPVLALGNQATQRILRQTANVDQVSAGLPCVVSDVAGPHPPNNVQFPVNASALTRADRTSLTPIADAWASSGGTARLRVDGYASVDGPQDFNWRL